MIVSTMRIDAISSDVQKNIEFVKNKSIYLDAAHKKKIKKNKHIINLIRPITDHSLQNNLNIDIQNNCICSNFTFAQLHTE